MSHQLVETRVACVAEGVRYDAAEAEGARVTEGVRIVGIIV